MDLSTLQLFAEDLICPVCLEEFDDPRVLPCHHYYCAKCIQGLARTTEYLLCPECRTVAVVSRNGDGLSMFPPAFMVNRLKEKVDKSREQLLASSGGGIALCSDHSGCPVMFACLDCHLAVCPKCLTSNHKGHSYDSLAKCGSLDRRSQGFIKLPQGITTPATENGGVHRSPREASRSHDLRGDDESKPPPLPRRVTATALFSPTTLNLTPSPPLQGMSSSVDFSPTLEVESPLHEVTAPPIPPRKTTKSLTVVETWYYEVDRADDRIHHIKVLRLNGKYSLQPSNFKSRVEFESLVDLVVHHSEHAFAVSDFFAKLKYAVNAD